MWKGPYEYKIYIGRAGEKDRVCLSGQNASASGVDPQFLCQRTKINKLEDYERLEFLGDAVLELVSSEFLFPRTPKCRRES